MKTDLKTMAMKNWRAERERKEGKGRGVVVNHLYSLAQGFLGEAKWKAVTISLRVAQGELYMLHVSTVK